MDMRRILVMNGPNLDMLGTREPKIYGSETLADLERLVAGYCRGLGIEADCFQSNSEGELIEKIHSAQGLYDGIVYNPGAHTHYSYAIRDAIGSVDVPVVEVHISDIDEREPFRSISVTAPACIGQIKGLGFEGYCRGVDMLRDARGLERLGEPAASCAPVQGAADLGECASQPGYDAEGANRALLSHERLNLLRLACSRLGVGAMMVRDTANIEWLTALDGVFDEERAHALLVSANAAMLHTDSRYANAIRTALGADDDTVIVDDTRMGHCERAHGLLTQGGAEAFGAKLGIEDSITYAEYANMVEEFGASDLVPTSDVVLRLRSVKDADEIARLKAAQAITDAAFSHIVSYMRPGMTERDVQIELEDFMLRHGAGSLAFRSIVACGANGADPHAVPGDTRLQAGQCVVLDFGARAHGYCADMTRTVFLGEPDAEMASAWEVLRRANEAVESYLRPGVTGKEAHELAERVLAEGGYAGAMGHGLGHGVGLEVHELPVLSPRNADPLVEGNVVTVEPGIYIPGSFGMRLEDFGAITCDGFEVFTQSTHEMVII